MKVRLILSSFCIFIVFILVLLGMNGYQYVKLKSTFIEDMIQHISAFEQKELNTNLKDLEDSLRLVRDLGKGVELGRDDIDLLNEKYFPFIENQSSIEAVILADTKGREYSVVRNGPGFLTRYTSGQREEGRNEYVYQEWDIHSNFLRKYERYENCSPLERSWFQGAISAEKPYWTDINNSFYSGKQVFMLSIAGLLRGPEVKVENVFGLEIAVDGIEKLLREFSEEAAGLVFLTDQDGSFVRSTSGSMIRVNSRYFEENLESLFAQCIAKWSEKGRPLNEIVECSIDDIDWVSSFQKVNELNKTIWLGLVLPESEIENPINEAVFQVDIVEVVIALLGALITLFFLYWFDFWRTGERKKKTPSEIVVYSLQQGEGAGVEFKSTIRTDIKTGKRRKEIEFAWLKAIVAFLNSQGGCLLIGVNDSGEVTGVEVDGFENEDKCLLNIKNLINTHIGAEFSQFITVTMVNFSKRLIVLVCCRPAGKPVFLKIGKNEEFYIRSGPSSTKLTPSQILDYLKF